MGLCASKEESAHVAQVTKRPAAPVTLASNTQQLRSPSNDKEISSSSDIVDTEHTTVNKANGGGTQSNPDVKMLLLGSGESGNSTILKQIKIIHQNGFSERELFDYKPFVFKNICECSQAIVGALRKLNMTEKLETIKDEDLNEIMNYEVPMDENSDSMEFAIGDKIQTLLKEPVVDTLLKEHRDDFYLMDSAQYFFENLDRILSKGYVPNVTDVLRTRKQTSGIYDTRFKLEDINIHLFDVGGQRSERKKWIHCFDNVTVIMFCVALSEYDQVLLESPTQNRLVESLDLFESVVNSMWFRRTSVILCLNKIDVFIDKLPRSPLGKYFPDYVGGNDVNKAVKYILWRFKQLNRAHLNLVPYVTQATDTNNIKLAFAVVKETILHNALMDSGILKS